MKVVLINTFGGFGGAAIACERLAQAHVRNGIDCDVFVLENRGVYDAITPKISISTKLPLYAEKLHFLLHEKDAAVRFQFSSARYGSAITEHPIIKEADIIHLHWVNQGLLSLKGLEKLLLLNKPIVWTLHDMWAFTGGCHYSGDCINYEANCGNCKYLRHPSSKDLSFKVLKKKMDIQGYSMINFVTCSKWLKTKANKSSLLVHSDVKAIPNPIDTDLYAPLEGISENKTNILFQSMNVADERKGLKYLLEALATLIENNPDLVNKVRLLIFGSGSENISFDSSVEIEALGYLSSRQDIIATYQRASIFVIPSLEDNLPNTVMESMSCGTPVVGFNTGGIPEMVDHLVNGYISKRKDSADLSNGILWLISDAARLEEFSIKAREKVLSEYAMPKVSGQYLDLYNSLL